MNAKEAMERTNKVIEERETKEKQEAIKYLEEVVEKAIQEACDREERCCDINKMGIVLQNNTIEKKLNELGYTVTNLIASRQFKISW
jgi:hypothetical protein